MAEAFRLPIVDVWQVARLPYKASRIRCFDIETTGTLAFRDEVLSLSVVDGDGRVLYDRMFSPERAKAWPEAQSVNGISPDDVRGLPSLRSCASEVSGVFSGACLFLAYCANDFDFRFLDAAGVKFPDGFEVDVLYSFARVFGDFDSERGEYRWKRLSVAVGLFGGDFAESYVPHGSLADSLACLHVFRELCKLPAPRLPEVGKDFL